MLAAVCDRTLGPAPPPLRALSHVTACPPALPIAPLLTVVEKRAASEGFWFLLQTASLAVKSVSNTRVCLHTHTLSRQLERKPPITDQVW